MRFLSFTASFPPYARWVGRAMRAFTDRDIPIHCKVARGRALLRHAEGKTDRLSRWALAVQARRGANVAAVALANKLARIAWAVLARDRIYRADWAEQSV